MLRFLMLKYWRQQLFLCWSFYAPVPCRCRVRRYMSFFPVVYWQNALTNEAPHFEVWNIDCTHAAIGPHGTLLWQWPIAISPQFRLPLQGPMLLIITIS
jgi:hypothetical protein